MHVKDGIAVEPGAVVSAAKPALPGVGAGAVILIGTWIGLIAGFCDVGFLVMNKRLIFRDFYRLGADFPWIIPSGVMVLVLVPALLIALFARIRGSVRLGVPVLLLSFIGFLDLCCPASARAVGDGDHIHCDWPFSRFGWYGRGRPVFAVGAVDGWMAGRDPGRDHVRDRRRTRLVGVSPASRTCRRRRRRAERALDRVGHGAGRQHEFAWVPSTDDTKSSAAGEPRRAVRPGVRVVVVDVAFTREHAYRTMAS